jgi:hypothetical protein
MPRKPRPTREQKQGKNPDGIPTGSSRYAAKVERRRRLAVSQGVPVAPLPILTGAARGSREELPEVPQDKQPGDPLEDPVNLYEGYNDVPWWLNI